MLTIKTTSRDFTEVEQYLMTLDPAITSVKDLADGTVINVAGYMIFEDTKDNGETVEVMSIIDNDMKCYACQSATFKRAVQDIHNIMGDKPFSVNKISGKTKAGRDYINCTLNIASVK